MTNPISQSSWNGKDSQTTQIGIINCGLSYIDVKTIAQDIFNNNILKLSKESGELAFLRSQELISKFIDQLQSSNTAVESIKEPSFQHMLLEAQKTYAKSWDKDLCNVLVDILVDRMSESQRNLKQIVLEESINTLSKLTASQLNILTILFLIKNTIQLNINTIDDLKKYFAKRINPFLDCLSKEKSIFQHLIFTSCCSAGSIWLNPIESILKDKYPWLFTKGFEQVIFEREIWPIDNYEWLVNKYINDSEKIQFNCIGIEDFDKFSLPNDIKIRAISLFRKTLFSDIEIKAKLIEISPDIIWKLIDIWDNSEMNLMLLTSVWIAIAHANLKRKITQSLDLNIWIKD